MLSSLGLVGAFFAIPTSRMLSTGRGIERYPRAYPLHRNGSASYTVWPRLTLCSHCSTVNAELSHGCKNAAPVCIDNRRQQVTLSVLLRLAEQGRGPLDDFLVSRPEPTSIAFLSWLSDEVSSSRERSLEPLCEYLVLWRERKDEERMEELYSSTLESILDDVSKEHDQEGTLALAHDDRDRMREILTSNPKLLAAAVAEMVTGEPVVSSGIFEDPVHELIMQTYPFPASLSPEGVKRSHDAAADLASDLVSRRQSSVTSMIGRAKLTSEQADALMAGSASSRILKMVLLLPTQEERVACLPDCFTPPLEQDQVNKGNTEELWCTPAQLLSEIEGKIRSLTTEGKRSTERLLTAAPSTTISLSSLEDLRSRVKEHWLEGI